MISRSYGGQVPQIPGDRPDDIPTPPQSIVINASEQDVILFRIAMGQNTGEITIAATTIAQIIRDRTQMPAQTNGFSGDIQVGDGFDYVTGPASAGEILNASAKVRRS